MISIEMEPNQIIAPEEEVAADAEGSKKRGGSNDLEGVRGRKSLKKQVGTRAKLLLCIEISEKDRTDLTESARSWTISTLNPIMACFKNHFDGNIDAFCVKWPNLQHSGFKKNCCRGVLNCGV
jgi:hypothetical protein